MAFVLFFAVIFFIAVCDTFINGECGKLDFILVEIGVIFMAFYLVVVKDVFGLMHLFM